MLEHEHDVREGPRQLRAVHHLGSENLQFEEQAVIGQQGEATAPIRIVHDIGARREAILRILVPMHLLPDAPRRRQRGQPLEQGAGVGVGKVGVGDLACGQPVASATD